MAPRLAAGGALRRGLPVALLGVLAPCCAGAECGARAHVGGAAAFGEQIDGLECPGFGEERSCCKALPAQKVLAYVEYALTHNREHLESLEPVAVEAERLLRETATSGGECADATEAMIRSRIQGVRSLATHSLGTLPAVKHALLSTLCRYCYSKEGDESTPKEMQAFQKVNVFSVLAQSVQEQIRQADEEVMLMMGHAGSHPCIPEYLSVLSTGSPVGGNTGTHTGLGAHTFEVMQAATDALEALSRWPAERRTRSESFRSEAAGHFDEDFFEFANQLFGAVVGPGARIAHQTQLLAMSIWGAFRKELGAGRSAVRLMWGPSALAAPPAANTPVQDVVGEASVGQRRAAPTLVASAALDTSDDPGSAFGMVVLISNRTSESMVSQLLERIDGPRALFLEDVCGDALESLGSGCHSGGDQQRKCLTPVHATRIVERTRGDPRPPHVAWRRHSGTRTVAHSAWALASSLWGPGCKAWLVDLRTHGGCLGQPPLRDAVNLVPGGRLKLVRDPEALLGLSAQEGDVAPETPAALGQAPVVADLDADVLPDIPLSTRLADYMDFHRAGVAALAKDPNADVRVLVYSCQPYVQCGGHGDRLNGIVTAFFLAVLTRRVFLIDSESPLPLQTLLVPRLIDWRVRQGLLSTAGFRHFSYHDRRRQFEADLPALAEYSENVLVLTVNYRMLRMLFEAPVFRDTNAALGLPTHAPAYVVAEVFDLLFSPSPALHSEMASLRASLGHPQDGRFIAVHLRTGDVAWDPARHGKSDLSGFLSCARRAEEELGLPPGPETPWVLATDSVEVAEAAAASDEAMSGKLRVPGRGGRIHIDRSELGEVLEGVAANFAEWMLFGRAAAVVLSRSHFGETAAEMGRVPFAYFAPGGGCVRTELTSS